MTHYNSCVSGVSSFGFGGTNAHAMAFANNVCTKRDVTKKDYRSLMMQKILQVRRDRRAYCFESALSAEMLEGRPEMELGKQTGACETCHLKGHLKICLAF